MKKVIIVIVIIFAVVIAGLLVLPVFFKGDILRLIKEKSSHYINAELNIEDVSLSMFKSFPNLNVTLENVSLTGEEQFAGDTLFYISSFEASVNLRSLIGGKDIIINKIALENTQLKFLADTSGKANWDIMRRSVEDTLPPTNEAKTKAKAENHTNIIFNDIIVKDLYVSYNDYKSSTYASVDKINLKLSGNFSETNTLIDVLLSLKNISFRQQNSIWINNTDLKWDAEIGANLKDMFFDIKKNDLALNDLKLDLTGNVGIHGDTCKMAIKLNTPDTKFESLLALVPKIYQKKIEGLQTSGDFSLNVTAMGEYYKDHFPKFDVNFVVNNANVKYPQLPESIDRINIALNISNPGGNWDATVIDLNKLSFYIANNPFNMAVHVTNPVDPVLAGEVKGVIDFSSLKKALPLTDITLQGVITTDVSFNGKYAYIEKEEYEKFIAKGSILLNNILFVNADFPKGISIPEGSIVVTPASLNLNNLKARIYSSDFTLKGTLNNYLPYLLKNQELRGNFTLNSNLIDLNEFMISSAPADTSTQKQEKTMSPNAAQGALEVPKNINLQLNTNIKTVLFDQLTINNIKGSIKLANAAASLNNLSMNILKGTLVINGKYSTVDPRMPRFDFRLNASDFDINSLYHSFSFIKKSLPMAMNCNGKISSAMNFSGALSPDMTVLMNTAHGDGYLSTQNVVINNNPVMTGLSTILKNEELGRLTISNLKINFKMQDGNITVEPFSTTIANNPTTIYGSQTVDGNVDYTMSMNIARKYFGKDIDKVLQAIPGSENISSLDIDVKVVGTLEKPIIKPDLSKALNTIRKEAEKELKNKAKDSILKGLNKLFKK